METGTGLVRLVMLLVKFVISPTTLEEKFCTVFTTDAAKVEPGRLGRFTEVPPPMPGVLLAGWLELDAAGAW